MEPVRLQRSRKKGEKLVSPNGLPNVYVGRPTKWGNPWSVKDFACDQVSVEDARVLATAYYREGSKFGHFKIPSREEIRRELRGKNLVCWCPLGEGSHCHADVLLEIANGEG